MSLSAPSMALVQYLRRRGAQSVDAILASHSQEGRPALTRRLGNLEACGWLERRSTQAGTVWAARADVPQRLRAQAKPPAAVETAAAGPLAGPLAVAAPRRVDVMHGPTYQPAATAVVRPGALDTRRIASRGTRC